MQSTEFASRFDALLADAGPMTGETLWRAFAALAREAVEDASDFPPEAGNGMLEFDIGAKLTMRRQLIMPGSRIAEVFVIGELEGVAPRSADSVDGYDDDVAAFVEEVEASDGFAAIRALGVRRVQRGFEFI